MNHLISLITFTGAGICAVTAIVLLFSQEWLLACIFSVFWYGFGHINILNNKETN